MITILSGDFNPVKHPYAEDSQSIPIQFTLCRYTAPNILEYLHHPTKCRDFLNDPFYAKEMERSFVIYGFKADKKIVDFLPEDVVPLSIRVNKKVFVDRIFENFSWLQRLEILYGWKPSEIVKSDNPSGKEIAVILNRNWAKASISFSFSTFLLKLLATLKLNGNERFSELAVLLRETDNFTDNDLMRRAENFSGLMKMDEFWLNLPAILEKVPTFTGVDTSLLSDQFHSLHNQGGFVSLLSGYHCAFVNGICQSRDQKYAETAWCKFSGLKPGA